MICYNSRDVLNRKPTKPTNNSPLKPQEELFSPTQDPITHRYCVVEFFKAKEVVN